MDLKIRKTLVGVVVQDNADKTISVKVETYKSNPIYKKRYKYSKKYLVHDVKNEAKIGDLVKIIETRPLSKKKYFRLFKITKKAVI